MAQGDDRDPFGSKRDKTAMRQQPGADRTPPDSQVPPPRPSHGGAARPMPAPQQRAVAPTSLSEFLIRGHNPLVSAATSLLVLGAQLRGTAQQPDVEILRRQTMQEVRSFEDRARSAGVPDDQVRIARYVLCTFVDLAVFATPWGGQSNWPAQSLLSAFEREAFGGEKFFLILEKALGEPDRYRDLIELQYLCLALGLETGDGGGPVDDRRRRDLEERALEFVRPARGQLLEGLSPHWEGVRNRRNPVRDLVPWWMAALVGLLIVLGGFLYWRAQLSDQTRPIKIALAHDALPPTYMPSPGPVAPSRLKLELAAQEQAGLLVVEEFDDRALVTLTAPKLFRSGSAAIDPAFNATLGSIAEAVSRVGGELLVVGHTDNEPIRSLRFQDNFDLSRARAIAVAELLQSRMAPGTRVEWKGVGDTQPRYQPPSTSENRARNRRVEIFHFPVQARP